MAPVSHKVSSDVDLSPCATKRLRTTHKPPISPVLLPRYRQKEVTRQVRENYAHD